MVRFDKRDWRASYKALIVLEYLLTHGPESVVEEFQKDRDVITQMEKFQYTDEKGLVYTYIFSNLYLFRCIINSCHVYILLCVKI